MDRPHVYRSQVLEHRGRVAGRFDDLGLGEVIDHATPQNPALPSVTAGHAVKAMVLNGRGLVNPPLDLGPRLFQAKPTARLLAPGVIAAKPLHDEALGRAVDPRYADGVTARDRRMAATAAARWGLTPRGAPLESTSVHGDGRYHSDHAPDEPVVHLTRG